MQQTSNDFIKYLKLKSLFLDAGCVPDEHGNISELKRFQYLTKVKKVEWVEALAEVLPHDVSL